MAKPGLAAEATKPASTAVPAIDNVIATASSVPVMTPSATPTPQPAATWTPALAPAVIARQPVNIRRGPGLLYDVIAGLREGQRADILNRDPAGNWWQIRINAERLGWVFAGVVDTEGETAAIAVAADIPDPPPFV